MSPVVLPCFWRTEGGDDNEVAGHGPGADTRVEEIHNLLRFPVFRDNDEEVEVTVRCRLPGRRRPEQDDAQRVSQFDDLLNHAAHVPLELGSPHVGTLALATHERNPRAVLTVAAARLLRAVACPVVVRWPCGRSGCTRSRRRRRGRGGRGR